MLILLFIITQIASEGSWFSTKGNKIVNSAGKEVRISGLNWFGFETDSRVFHGLWIADFHKIMSEVAERGFNCFRVPVSADLLHEWKDGKAPKISNINYYVNPDLDGLSSQEVFDYFLAECKKYQLRVFIDVHGIAPDSFNDNLWYTPEKPPEYLFTALEYFADHYKNDDTVIGIDLKNEPHGYPEGPDVAEWNDSKADNNWKLAAETAGKRVLAKNPNLLIFVEGVEYYEGKWGWWGGNIQGALEYPIDLGSPSYQKQLVYSPHEYGPALYDQWWFHVEYDNFTFESLYKHHWYYHWMFIWEKEMAPLLIGEWGGKLDMANNVRWMKMVVDLILKYNLSQTYWCLNPNSGDTGGLLEGDWVTWDEDKYNLIKPVLTDKLL